MQPTPVKSAALDLELPVLQPESINSRHFRNSLAELDPEIGVVVAYGAILRSPLLELPDRGFINLHASALPAYRGAAPINWAIINGETTSGVTVIRMVEEMDAGPILARKTVPIERDDTAGDLHDRLADIGSDLLRGVVDDMDAGDPPEETLQDESEASYAPMLSGAHRVVDWSRPAEDVRNLVRGLTPWPGADATLHTEEEGKLKMTPLQMEADQETPEEQIPGTVLRTGGEGLVVQTGRGTVTIKKLKPAGGRAMSAADFLNGHEVRPGDRFE
ncbi:MAG: methionyl-tRNA formyltransferase [Planctomycetota bacterium]